MNRGLKTYSHIFKQEGTAQSERYLPALRPDHVAIDDRKLQDLILYAQRFSRNVLFVNTENNGVGITQSWEDLYKADPVLLLSNIAAKNVQEIRRIYDLLDQGFQKEITVENFVPVVEYILSRYTKLNQWYAASATDSSLKQDLQLYIRSYLSKKLTELRQIIFQVNGFSNQPTVVEFPKEAYPKEIWGDLNVEDKSFGQRIFIGNNDEDKLLNASFLLREIFDAAFHVTENITANCNAYLEETIKTKQNRPPHIALLITFLELYGYLREDLNKIPQRHLSYYYEQVLRIGIKEAIPDQVFVVFELVKGFEKYEIKKGAALSAGKDRRNNELVYEIDQDVVLHTAQVAEIKTLFVARDPRHHHRIVGYYTDALPKNPDQGPTPEVTFGRIFGSKKTEATVGLAIASPQFYLARGLRNVTVSFQSEDEIPVPEIDQSLLQLLLTGEKGWLGLDSKDMVAIRSFKKSDSHTIDLSFTVSIAQQSAIVAFDKRIHAGSFTTGAPVMQLRLKYPALPPDASQEEKNVYENKISQLHFLQTLRMKATRIEVEVGDVQAPVSFDGVRDLVLQNHEAILDAQKPFYPFSVFPKVGSSFYIGCKDLYYKEIQNLSLSIEWMLPDNFGHYYANYLPPYNANPFRSTLSILDDKQWRKISEVTTIDVLANDPKFRSIKVDSNQIKRAKEGSNPETAVNKFDVSKADGTLKLKLNYPDFGHSVYPQLITSSVMKMTSSQEDYVKKIKRELRDSVISIKLPDKVSKNPASTKTLVDLITEILEKVPDNDQARNLLVKGLSGIIRAYNDVNSLFEGASGSAGKGQASATGGAMIVNDDNFIERILRRLKLRHQTKHYDQDKDTVEEVVDALKENMDDDIDDEEVMKLIIDETSDTIHRTVVKVADKLIAARSAGVPQAQAIRSVLNAEFEEANEDINDSLAKKIATFLLLDQVPPTPYTPLINAISLSYRSARLCAEGEDQFFQITPFGVIEIDPFTEAVPRASDQKGPKVSTNHLFPSAFVEAVAASSQQPVALLFIGIKDLAPHQNLFLLFQFAEGTQKTDQAPPLVSWWYLSHNDWVKLAADRLVSDATYGLQTTGIVQISVPPDATGHNTAFDGSDLYWLCASVEGDTGPFPGLIRVVANATTATFKNQNNDPTHQALPLPAKKITRLVEMNPAIKKIDQPVASTHGKVKERDQEYFTRVSERLRHKSRAINNWDYERLVLEHFPAIFKVKCLNNYYAGNFAAAHVTVVPIGDLRNRSDVTADMLLTKVNDITLKNIEKLLRSKSSPFVKVHAINPQLDQVLINCKIKFHRGVDQGFYLQKLNEDLITHLTPWASGDHESVSFSAKVYASSVINFIDDRTYVDYVTDLSMNQYTENEQGNKVFCRADSQSISLVETQFTKGHSILVSAPRHRIEVVQQAGEIRKP